jgi:hypothetical protein
MGVEQLNLSAKITESILKYSKCKSLKGAQIKYDILECQTEERIEPELYALTMLMLELLSAINEESTDGQV